MPNRYRSWEQVLLDKREDISNKLSSLSVNEGARQTALLKELDEVNEKLKDLNEYL